MCRSSEFRHPWLGWYYHNNSVACFYVILWSSQHHTSVSRKKLLVDAFQRCFFFCLWRVGLLLRIIGCAGIPQGKLDSMSCLQKGMAVKHTFKTCTAAAPLFKNCDLLEGSRACC